MSLAPTTRSPEIEATADIEASLVDTLFAQRSSIVVGSLGLIATGLFCWVWTRESWLLALTSACIVVTAGRLWLGARYDRRTVRTRPNVWARRFAVGAALNSLIWGVGVSIAILHSDPRTQMAMITAQGAYVTISAVRNNAVRLVAMVQIIPPFGLSCLASMASGNVFYISYSVLILIHIYMSLEITRFLRKKTLDLLLAEQKTANAMKELALANRRLETIAMTDALTSAMNRRGFDAALARPSHGGPISLLLLDLDHFKYLNDALGYPAGDACLQRIAICLRRLFQGPDDVVARYGGEEFAVLLTDTDYAQAAIFAEKARVAIHALGVAHPKNVFGTATVSVGFATSVDQDVDGAALLEAADEALYRAKMTGRNKISGSRGQEKPPQLALSRAS